MHYPYFAATLPMLLPDAPPPLPVGRFLAQAREHLAAGDLRTLEALLDEAPCGHPFVQGWRRHETQLRNAIARHRAARLGLDPAPHLRPHTGFDVTLERGVAAAFQEADPLRRERALDALRWRCAGELAGLEPFSAAALLAYAVRLRLAERAAARDPVQGRARRATLVALPAAWRTATAAAAEF